MEMKLSLGLKRCKESVVNMTLSMSEELLKDRLKNFELSSKLGMGGQQYFAKEMGWSRGDKSTG